MQQKSHWFIIFCIVLTISLIIIYIIFRCTKLCNKTYLSIIYSNNDTGNEPANQRGKILRSFIPRRRASYRDGNNIELRENSSVGFSKFEKHKHYNCHYPIIILNSINFRLYFYFILTLDIH